MIDPAILRPGRLDVRSRSSRPDADAGGYIFPVPDRDRCRYTPTTIAEFVATSSACIEAMIQRSSSGLLRDGGDRFLEVTYPTVTRRS